MKTFILDTSVLIYDPNALFAFKGNRVVMPLVVLEELDGLKSDKGERGRNARLVHRTLDALSQEHGELNNVKLPSSGSLHVLVQNIEIHHRHLEKTNDNQIIGIANDIRDCLVAANIELRPDEEYILVSKDIAMRTKARSLGVTAEDYRSDAVEKVDIGKLGDFRVDVTVIDKLYKGERKLPQEDIIELELGEALENQCAVFTSNTGQSQSALARFSNNTWRAIRKKEPTFTIEPRNAEQACLLDVLLDDKIDCVICNGAAGAGKTLLTMAAGLEHVLKGKKHNGHQIERLMITKAVQEVGEKIGFTPGTAEEKMAEWTKPFFDNMDFLLRRGQDKTLQQLQEKSLVEIDAITYMRGRSLMNKFVVVDEVQNLAPMVIRTIVSRIASSSKLVMLGDITQIDNPYLSIRNNGLIYAMSRLQNEPRIAILNMTKSERSPLSKIAVEKL